MAAIFSSTTAQLRSARKSPPSLKITTSAGTRNQPNHSLAKSKKSCEASDFGVACARVKTTDGRGSKGLVRINVPPWPEISQRIRLRHGIVDQAVRSR